jgi:hypothetical protein
MRIPAALITVLALTACADPAPKNEVTQMSIETVALLLYVEGMT